MEGLRGNPRAILPRDQRPAAGLLEEINEWGPVGGAFLPNPSTHQAQGGHHMSKEEWGPRRPWPDDRPADAIPPDIKEGDWVKSDLIIRAHKIHRISDNRSAVYPNEVWRIKNGDSFRLRPTSDGYTHQVGSWYQIWDGFGIPPEEAQKLIDEKITEEELLEVLRHAVETEELEDA